MKTKKQKNTILKFNNNKKFKISYMDKKYDYKVAFQIIRDIVGQYEKAINKELDYRIDHKDQYNSFYKTDTDVLLELRRQIEKLDHILFRIAWTTTHEIDVLDKINKYLSNLEDASCEKLFHQKKSG